MARSPRCDHRALTFVSLALSLAFGAAAIVSVTPGIIGLFHDDGIYAVVAKSLAEHGEYRTASVPGLPVETKYPPLYPLLLSIVWRVAPVFPENVVALKALNGAFIALTLYGVSRLATPLSPRSILVPVLAMFLVATSPSVVGFADFTMSDTMFLALVVWTACFATPAVDRAGWVRELVIAGLVSAAILTRSIGIAVGIAMTLERAMRRRWREASLHCAVTVLVFCGWAIWGSLNRDPGAGPLVDYYQSYEKTALGYLLSDPGMAWSIVSGNLRMIADAAFLVASPSLRFLWPLYAALGVLGACRWVRDRSWFILAFASLCLSAVLVYPFAPHRYLIPLVPFFYLSVLAGGVWLAQVLATRLRAERARWAFVVLAAAPLVVGNVVWSVHQASGRGDGRARAWYGADLGHDWSGFQEAFGWIREHTSREARIATMFDPMYFLYTGRLAVRPWHHHPETYFYPYAAAKPFVGDAQEIADELRRLGIDYVVLDPATGYAEGESATRMLRALIRLPEVRGALEYTTSDRRHEIYRLWSGERPAH